VFTDRLERPTLGSGAHHPRRLTSTAAAHRRPTLAWILTLGFRPNTTPATCHRNDNMSLPLFHHGHGPVGIGEAGGEQVGVVRRLPEAHLDGQSRGPWVRVPSSPLQTPSSASQGAHRLRVLLIGLAAELAATDYGGRMRQPLDDDGAYEMRSNPLFRLGSAVCRTTRHRRVPPRDGRRLRSSNSRDH
jgi:hypothetical protein